MQTCAVLLASGCVWGPAQEPLALRSTQQEPISDNEPFTVGMTTDSSVPNSSRRSVHVKSLQKPLFCGEEQLQGWKQWQLRSSRCVRPEKLTFQQNQRLGEDSRTETQTSSPHIHTTQKGRRNCIRMGRCAPSQLMELGCRSCCGTPLLGCIRCCVFSALKWQLYKLLQSTGSHQGIVLKQSWYLHLFVSPHTNAQEFLGFLNCSTVGNHYTFW